MPAFKAGEKLGLFGKKENTARTLPRHIAIVMDGNGRWAKKARSAALGRACIGR